MIMKSKVERSDYKKIHEAIKDHCILGHYSFHLIRILTVLFQIFAKISILMKIVSLLCTIFPSQCLRLQLKNSNTSMKFTAVLPRRITAPVWSRKKNRLIKFHFHHQAKRLKTLVLWSNVMNVESMHSKLKLKKDSAVKLNRFNQEFVYSCGTVLQDMVLYDEQYNNIITNVFVNKGSKNKFLLHTNHSIPSYL